MVNRPAVFAGQFYESDPEELRSRIEWCFKHELGPGRLPEPARVRNKEAVGYIVPHAGYIYSGPVAAYAYLSISLEGLPHTFILIGPNHTGVGPAISVFPEGFWETPLGDVEIDSDLVAEIVKHSKFVKLDTSAHEREHSLEVQLPFLQYIFGSTFKIVPITMLYQTPETAKDLASAIRRAVEELGRDATVISTTDLTHYEPHELALRKDEEVLKKVEAVDPEGLYSVVIEKDISMCGVGPVMTILYLSIQIGRRRSKLLKHATSGDVTGERSWVVGYASLAVY
ncbi:MAG: AmmeMemoRadiSam system protein B [Desulfurococcales archaeon]|nr:AmmeMemoRadiSam system protein B [Desulfurococcales archaeon]